MYATLNSQLNIACEDNDNQCILDFLNILYLSFYIIYRNDNYITNITCIVLRGIQVSDIMPEAQIF